MLNVISALRLAAGDSACSTYRMTLEQCADQLERALLEIDTSKDFVCHPSLAVEALERARVRIVGTAALIPPASLKAQDAAA